MRDVLGTLAVVIPIFIYIAILMFFIRATTPLLEHLGRIVTVLREIRDRLPDKMDNTDYNK